MTEYYRNIILGNLAGMFISDIKADMEIRSPFWNFVFRFFIVMGFFRGILRAFVSLLSAVYLVPCRSLARRNFAYFRYGCPEIPSVSISNFFAWVRIFFESLLIFLPDLDDLDLPSIFPLFT